MPLCEVCSNIDIRALLAAAQERHNPPKLYSGNEPPSATVIPYEHYSTIFEVRDHAETCDFCAMIWEGEQWRTKDPEQEHYLRGDEKVLIFVFGHRYGYDEMKGKLAFWLHVQVGNVRSSEGYSMFRCLDTDDAVASLLPKLLPKNSGSPEGLKKAKEWLRACEADHPDCHRVDEGCTPLPTRVLHVGKVGDLVTLYETEGRAGAWAALSYCWGGLSDFVLNSSTYSSMLGGKPLESFPATIRDAIITTRELGIQYLWVDALCIMQGSMDDWNREAPKMSQIYNKALLTLVVAAERSAYSGIFRDRSGTGNGMWSDPSCRLPWKLEIDSADSNSQSEAGSEQEAIHVQEGFARRSDWAGPGPDNSVWASRGWTLQEELLSWRTLTFMPDELLWSCPSIQVWESGPPRVAAVDFSRDYNTQTVQRVKPNLGHFGLTETGETRDSGFSSLTGLRTLTTSEIYSAWYSMCENYSKRKLTKDTDKLIAIAGLAKDTHAFIKDNYCAGLWENDIIAGLMWTFDSESWFDTEIYDVEPGSKASSWGWGKLKPNSDLRLPSWSWVSINNEVYWRLKQVIGKPQQGSVAEDGKATKRYVKLAEVEKIHITNDWAHYGSPKKCEVIITAPSYSWSVSNDEVAQTWPKFHAPLIERLKDDPEYQARHQEHPNQIIIVQQLVRIETLATGLEGKSEISDMNWGILVLESVGIPDIPAASAGTEAAYKRVSFFYLDYTATHMELEKEAPWPKKSVRLV